MGSLHVWISGIGGCDWAKLRSLRETNKCCLNLCNIETPETDTRKKIIQNAFYITKGTAEGQGDEGPDAVSPFSIHHAFV